jgi:hypothetical protein
VGNSAHGTRATARRSFRGVKALAFVLLAACGTTPSPSGPITGVLDHDQTWSGAVDLKGFVTVDKGVTVTVDAGTTVNIATGASIEVDGTLAVGGTKDAPITIAPVDPGQHWLGIQVAGTMTMSYATQTGGAISTIDPHASVTITDSQLSNALGDFLIVDGGSMDVQYSTLGIESGDHTHCNVHINSVTSFKFTHNTNAGVAYGLMLYAGHADFTHNNWIGNVYDIEPAPAGVGTFDGSYFAKGMPSGIGGSSFENLATARLTDAQPR